MNFGVLAQMEDSEFFLPFNDLGSMETLFRVQIGRWFIYEVYVSWFT